MPTVVTIVPIEEKLRMTHEQIDEIIRRLTVLDTKRDMLTEFLAKSRARLLALQTEKKESNV